MSLKTKLLVLGSMLGFVAASQRANHPVFEVEGEKETSVFHRVFSGHRYHKTYPTLNWENAVRKGMHQRMIKELADSGICWTPYGLYHMNHV